MEINEKAKHLLLGHNCTNCKYLKNTLLNPNTLEETHNHEQYRPGSFWVERKCLELNKIIPEPETYICEKYVHDPDKTLVEHT